ncbi:hypothetical protein J056_002281 [Wallemia ichthyophaga EXF-994]|nr:uncharacterized protein J056_002281 [Wallemia ichthyophaga EXF-994]EOR04203.1 hypothetical protein J056_002281 [Wallemia ichthyophaga EXF-994]
MQQQHPKDRRSFDYVWRSMVAGGTAGCVAKTSIAPFDRVKILFQASNPEFKKYAGSWTGVFKALRPIYNENGVRGLLQGHSATLARIFPYAAIKWAAYEQVRHFYAPSESQVTPLSGFLSGSTAGLISVLCTYPLELIRVRTAFKTRHKGRVRLGDVMRDIYHEGQPPPPKSATTAKYSRKLLNKVSVLKFYRGFSMTMVGIIPYAGTSFLIFEQASKSQHIRTLFTSKGASDLFCGGMAGAIGQTAAYPFEVIRRRMQVGGLLHPDRFVNFNETCSLIYKQSGYRGFFVGLTIGYLKVIPMNAISFATYNFTKRLLLKDN